MRVQKPGSALALALLGLALAGTPFAQPSPPGGRAELYPALTGLYEVGVIDLALSDPSRRELFGPQPGGPRELGLIVWYPAAQAEGRRSPIARRPDVILPAYAKAMGYPPAVAEAFRGQLSHAYEGAPVARGRRFPVVVFSHGYADGFAGQDTALCEELASHGYVVVSIGHTYEGFITLLKDGKVAPGDTSRTKAFMDELRTLAPTVTNSPVLNRSLDVWVKDTRFVVDQLSKLDRVGASPQLVKAMDTRQVAFTGMSFGGAVAPLACAEDDRCKAAVNLDGFQYGHFAGPLSKPVLFMTRVDDRDHNYGVFRQAKGPAAYVVVPGATHLDFTDLPLMTHPGPAPKPGGPIGGRRMQALVAEFTRTFLDETVKHSASARLADVKDHFPEVEMTIAGKLE